MGRPMNGVSHHIGIPHKELRSLRLIQNCWGKDGRKQDGRVLEICENYPIMAAVGINPIRICRQEFGDVGGLEARPTTLFRNYSQCPSSHMYTSQSQSLLRNSNPFNDLALTISRSMFKELVQCRLSWSRKSNHILSPRFYDQNALAAIIRVRPWPQYNDYRV
jgi:hypothetical protein